MALQLHNTLTKKLETFAPTQDSKVTLYTCGPTVYDRMTVGNWTAYIYWDTLVRTLIINGYKVERVMNMTDVGHLTGENEGDANTGEDKLEKGARREGKTAWEVAEFYSEDFLAGMEKLGLITPEHIVRATDFIPQQLDLVRILKEKGYTYQIDDGIYFDTSKFPKYADFAGLDLAAQKAGARVEFNPEKRNHSDFALWKFTPAGETRDMEWETPIDLLDSSSSLAPISPQGRSTGADNGSLWRSARPEGDIPSDKQEQGTRHTDSVATQVSSHSHPQITDTLEAKSELVPSSQAKHADARQGEPEHQTEPYTKYGEGEAESSTQHSAASSSKIASLAGQQVTAVLEPVMGFPGWHLECSAMAMSILGPTIDIHTGGIDHIPVHHTNEIAQSESASGQIFARFWLHNNHLKSDGTKISKSLGNGYTLQDLEKRGFTPLDFRMFVLQGQYSNEGNFTFDNLTAAKNRLHHWRNVAALRHQLHDTLIDDSEKLVGDKSIPLVAARGAILEALNNNLNTPEALRVVDQAFSKLDGKPLGSIHQHGLEQVIDTIDEILGLQLRATTPDLQDDTKQLILGRQRAREEKNWVKSDQIRQELEAQGIIIQDTTSGSIWKYFEYQDI